jgi:RimJ/RimL family protein N-acetyltransferase
MIDAAFEQEVALPGVPRVRLRSIRPDDEALLREGFARLSPASRYARFHTSMRELSSGLLHQLTHVDGIDHCALVAVDAAGQGMAVARFVRLPEDRESAELAVTVGDALQGRGLAPLLLQPLADAAEERGIRWFIGYVLTDNLKARKLMNKLDAEWLGSARGMATYRLSVARLRAGRSVPSAA